LKDPAIQDKNEFITLTVRLRGVELRQMDNCLFLAGYVMKAILVYKTRRKIRKKKIGEKAGRQRRIREAKLTEEKLLCSSSSRSKGQGFEE
jgi:hypothetical protein